jgi:hypothetical protein
MYVHVHAPIKAQRDGAQFFTLLGRFAPVVFDGFML